MLIEINNKEIVTIRIVDEDYSELYLNDFKISSIHQENGMEYLIFEKVLDIKSAMHFKIEEPDGGINSEQIKDILREEISIDVFDWDRSKLEGLDQATRRIFDLIKTQFNFKS